MQGSQETKEDEKDRSRGKRRTAREIAQMFEQLKQRHLARKKEWHCEKQELLKQVSVAEESKFLLVELKCLLEELKNQLGNEEKKRIQVEEEYEIAKVDWGVEKERLLKRIANLESKRLVEIGHDRNLTDELDVVKSRLAAREKDLALVKKSNTDFQKSTQEIQRKFEAEKQNIIKTHEGEKRNWEKTRQVMLDKIDLLQEELRSSRIPPFPLHGSHVGSPFDDAISGLTSSPDMEDYFSTESKTPIAARTNAILANVSEAAGTSYGHIQRTVDQALDQIERITGDFKQVASKESDQINSSAGSHSAKLSSQTTTLSTADSSRWLSMETSSLLEDEGKKLQAGDNKQLLTSSVNSRRDKTASPYSSYYGLKQKEQQQYSNNPDNDKKSFYQSLQGSGKVSASPDVSLSPSESCSIPTFTESSADSPQALLSSKPDELSNPSQTLETPDKPFLKQAQKTKKRDSSEGPTTKQLPSLHQQLLFGNATKTGTVQKESSPNDQTTATAKNSNYKQRSPYYANKASSSSKQQSRTHSKPIEQSKKVVEPESTEYHMKKQNRSKQQWSSTTSDFIEKPVSQKTVDRDFVDKHNLDSTPGPPVRPKPSVTIEKDTQGNVLRVLSDSKYSRQDSPGAIGSLDKSQSRGRRRRSQEVDHDLKPLILDKTNSISGGDKTDKIFNYRNKEPKQQEGFGSRGKNWIKKRLSFLESPQKEEEIIFPKTTKKREGPNSKPRTSSLRRGEGRKSMLKPSSSEESDDVSEKIQRKSGRKDATTEKRGKPKRYSRSKTDSTMDVRNLLAKFKASQFSSKKPSIVKEFEKKLLENEVKTLHDDKKKENSARKKESLRVTKTVREKRFEDDDGYRGEDELDHHIQRKTKSKTIPTPVVSSLVRSPSIRSLQEQLFSSRDSPRRYFHRSMIDLTSEDMFLEPTPEHTNYSERIPEKSLSPSAKSHHTKPIYEKAQEDNASPYFQLSPVSDDQTKQKSKFVFETKQNSKASSNSLTLPEAKPGGRFGKKRLSWAANLQQSFEDGPDGVPPPSPRSLNSSDQTTTSAVTGILLKPKLTVHDSTGSGKVSSEASKRNPDAVRVNDNKTKERMSTDMKKKADNLEKVLRKGPSTSKARRYKRSDTQPIAWSPSTEENDSDCSPSPGMIRSHSMSSETFTKEFHEVLTPGLTSRFKKPALTNRRLPSRWKKKS